MAVTIDAPVHGIGDAINTFDQQYHQGFFAVRELSDHYLHAAVPTAVLVQDLVTALRGVLRQYGAGEAGVANHGALNAPVLQNVDAFSQALTCPQLHADLRTLRALPISRLAMVDNRRVIQGVDAPNLAVFDETLIRTLNVLAERLFVFIGNRTATYPMKVVLLITGLMPALDSQVREGLSGAGFAGFRAPLTLSPDPQANSSIKITRLPFLLGECWQSGRPVLTDGINQSNYRRLINEPGRVFDILLFVQGRGQNPIRTINYQGNNRWYNFP